MDNELIIAGWTDYRTEDRNFVLGHLLVNALATRSEEGCHDFFVAADPSNSSRIITFERWASPDHHARHLESAHVRNYRAATSSVGQLDRSFRRFLVSESQEI